MTISQEQEKELLRRLKENFSKAWEEFVDNYSRLIYYSIQHTLKLKGYKWNEEEINELFQMIFLHIAEDKAKRLLKFEGKGGCSLASWVRTISVNFVIDYLRGQRTRKFDLEFQEIKPEKINEEWFISSSPEQLLLKQEEVRELEKAISGLSPDEKAMLKLFYEDGVSVEKLAKLFSLTKSSAYTKLSRIREKVRRALLASKNKEEAE